MLLAIKRLSQGKFPKAEQLRSNHAQAFGQLIRVQRMSQQGRLVWSVDVNRQTTPSQVCNPGHDHRPAASQSPVQLQLRQDNCVLDVLLTSCRLLKQVVKVWAYTVEGQLPALVRRVEAALRMYSREYVARCGLVRTPSFRQHSSCGSR